MTASSSGRSGAAPATSHESLEPDTTTHPTEWPRWYRASWVAAAVLFLAAFSLVRFGVSGARGSQLFSDGIVAAGALAAAFALTHFVRTTDPPMRQGWLLVTVGIWCEALGELTWFAFVVVLGEAPYPGLPDVLYLAGYPAIATGFVLLAFGTRGSRLRLRLTLDGLIVATALLTLGWHFVLQPLLVDGSPSLLETVVTVSYPVLDIVVASIAYVVAINSRGARRVPLLVVATGIFAWVVGDISFAVFELDGEYVYDELGLFWLLGHLAIALGALHPDAGADALTSDFRRYEFHELSFPYLPSALTGAVVLGLAFVGAVDQGDVSLAALAGSFLLVRQLYVHRDAARVSEDLETSERELNRRNQELLLVNRIVRHDIRNDMNVAHGWANELRDHVDDDGQWMLDRVLRTTRNTIELTETFREFVDVLESDAELDTEPTALDEHLCGTVERCRETYPDATFVVGDVPAVAVCANPLLGTVFRNLLNNAVQHNDADDPRVEVTVDYDGDTVRVRIADNGPGIPPELRSRLFHEGVTGVESGGTGIGLYLVDTLVSQYGGHVHVEDADGRGTVFVVELPRVE